MSSAPVWRWCHDRKQDAAEGTIKFVYFKTLHHLCLLGIGLLVCSPTPVLASSTEAESLRQELTEVRSRITEAEESLAQKTKNLWTKQHRLEYQDPEAIALREKIRALEAQLLELRKSLEVRLSLIDGVRDLEKEREGLVQELHDLRETEELIQKELAIAERQS